MVLVDPWTSSYHPPSVRFEGWCSVNDGVEISLYNLFRKISVWLEVAFKATWDVVRQGMKLLYIVFPSQVALEVIKDWEVQDFALEEKKFWAIQFWILGMRQKPMAFPKLSLSENFWTSLFAPLNVAIPGSENLLYLDPSDGIIKFGYQFEPTKYYYLLSDGVRDMKEIGIILAILYVCRKLGLFKVAGSIIKQAFKYFSSMKWKGDIDDTNDQIHYLFDEIVMDGENVNDRFDKHDKDLKDIADRVGIRLILK